MDDHTAWTLLFLFTVFFAPSFWLMAEAYRRRRRTRNKKGYDPEIERMIDDIFRLPKAERKELAAHLLRKLQEREEQVGTNP